MLCRGFKIEDLGLLWEGPGGLLPLFPRGTTLSKGGINVDSVNLSCPVCRTYRLAPMVEQSSVIAWYWCLNLGSFHFYTWSASLPVKPALAIYYSTFYSVLFARVSFTAAAIATATHAVTITATFMATLTDKEIRSNQRHV